MREPAGGGEAPGWPLREAAALCAPGVSVPPEPARLSGYRRLASGVAGSGWVREQTDTVWH